MPRHRDLCRTMSKMVSRRVKAIEARGILRLLPEGSITGREHSSPLKLTVLGKPSPAPTSIPGMLFLVKDMTDCTVPGTGGSFLGLSPLLSARSPAVREITKQMPVNADTTVVSTR